MIYIRATLYTYKFLEMYSFIYLFSNTYSWMKGGWIWYCGNWIIWSCFIRNLIYYSIYDNDKSYVTLSDLCLHLHNVSKIISPCLWEIARTRLNHGKQYFPSLHFLWSKPSLWQWNDNTCHYHFSNTANFRNTSIIYSVSKICYFIPYHTMKIYSNILTNYYGCTQKVNMLWTTMFGRKIHLNETIVGYISQGQYYKNRNLINHHVLKRCQICSKTLIDIIFLLYRASYDQYSPSRYHV